jgi:iron complex outermembrane receptor protein
MKHLSKNIFLFILFILSVELSIAQGTMVKNNIGTNGTLSGVVTDKKTGKPIQGVTIYTADLRMGSVTDSLGHYIFRLLPGGTYLIEARYLGYKTITKSVTIDGDVIENFVMTDNYIEQDAVVITGSSKAVQIKRNPVPIIAISNNYITQNLSSNIIDAIAKVPGVNAVTTGANISKPIIRGLGFNRVLTLYDGVRQEGQQWGDEHGIEVDQYAIERIEVIKGPASLSYGSDALAGVVNLIPTQPAPEGKMIGDISTEYQTNNGMFGGSGMLGATKNGFEWMARISHKQATNYQNSIDGRVFNTAFNETDANATFGLHRKWGYSHLSFSLFDDLQEIPDGSRDSATRKFTQQITEADTYRPIVSDAELKSYAMTPLHQHVQNYRVYSSNNFTVGSGRLAVNIGYQRSVRREFSHPEVPYQDIAGLFLQLNTYSYDVKYYFHDFHGWNLTAGVNGMYQDNTVTNGTEFVIPSYKQFDIGPFALLKKTFNKLDIAGGVRYDSRSFSNSELYTKPNPVTGFDTPVYGTDTTGADKPFSKYSHVYSGASGSVGATYNFSEKFSIKANVARGYRAPNVAEISANGVHPGTNVYQIGNDNFKPEFSFQEDIGAEYLSKYILVSLSLFNNTISNYIFNQKVGSGNGTLIDTFKFQQGKVQLYGGEASIDFHPIKALHFENSISAVYGLNRDVPAALKSDSNKYVASIPPLHGISELRYDFNSSSAHLIDGFVKVQLAYYATQNRVYLTDNTETRTPGYTLINAGIGSGFTNKKGIRIFNLYLMVNNVFDIAYQDHLSRLKYFEPYPNDPRGHSGIYNMGRNCSIKLDIPLSWNLKK